MKRLLPLLLLFLAADVYAQKAHDQLFTLTRKRNKDNTIDIICTKNRPGTYTIVLNFTNMQDAVIDSPEARAVLKGVGQVPVLTIYPTSSTIPPSFWYSYSTYEGVLDPEVDSAFVYRIPFSAGRQVLTPRFSPKNNGVGFSCQIGDTIYAPRKGMLYSIQPNKSNGTLNVTLENEDFTYTTIGGIKQGSMGLMKLGDTVFPDTQLGVAAAEFIPVSLFYRGIDTSKPKDRTYVKTFYVKPLFATEQGSVKVEPSSRYTVVADNDLIMKEMSNKEKKARLKAKK